MNKSKLQMINERIESIKSEQRSRYATVMDFSVDSLAVEKYFKWKAASDKEIDRLINERTKLKLNHI